MKMGAEELALCRSENERDPYVNGPLIDRLLTHITALESDLATSEAENKDLTQAANLLSLNLSETEAALRSIQEIGTLDETDDGGPWLDPAAQIAADYFAQKEGKG